MTLRKLLTLSIIVLAFNLIGLSQTKKPVGAKTTAPAPTATPVQTTGNKYSDYKISQKMDMGEKVLRLNKLLGQKEFVNDTNRKLLVDPNDKNSAMMAQYDAE